MTAIVLQAAAITLVIVRGSVFDWLRRFGPAWWCYLWGCPLCAGVWVGAAWFLARTGSYAFVGPSWWVWSARWAAPAPLDALAAGAITGCAALLAELVLELLEAAEASLDLRVDDLEARRAARDRVEDCPPTPRNDA